MTEPSGGMRTGRIRKMAAGCGRELERRKEYKLRTKTVTMGSRKECLLDKKLRDR